MCYLGGNISGIRLKYFHKVFVGIVLPEYIDWVKELVYIMVCIEENCNEKLMIQRVTTFQLTSHPQYTQ